MTRIITIDGSDHTASVRLESLALVEAAYGGEVGQGGFIRTDDARDDVPAMKDCQVDEDDASPTLMFDGFVGLRGIDRGKQARQEYLREFDVTLLDLNTVIDDQRFDTGDSANRPEETDYARVTWLLGTSAFAALGISAGVVPNTNTATMDARDYRTDGPRAVLDECSEAAKKNYFLYNYGAGGGRQLYYDLATGTSLSSSAKLSTVLADVDNVTTWAFDDTPQLQLDPTRIYTSVKFKYDGGYVVETDAGLEAQYRRREITIEDTAVKSAAKATARAQAYLASVGREVRIFTAAVTLPAANVNDIRAGQRIQCKVPHLTTAELDLDSFTWLRISRRVVTQADKGTGASGLFYTLTLEFADDLRPLRFGGQTGGGGDTAGTADGAAVGLTRYQLVDSPDFIALYTSLGGGAWDTTPQQYRFEALASPTNGIVGIDANFDNIAWYYAGCGGLTSGWTGRAYSEAWYRFDIDLADTTIVGVRVDVGAASGSGAAGAGYDMTAAVALVSPTVHSTVSYSPPPTKRGKWTALGSIDGAAGGSIFVPVDLLQDDGDGYCWFVLAPSWDTPYGRRICNGDPDALSAWWDMGDDASTVVSATAITVSGSGLSPWLPGIGATDGSNDTYSLPNWNGKGVPEVRVGNTVLGAGEYTYDASALTVTLNEPAPADMAGQVAFRFKMG